MVTNMKVTVLWDVALRSLVETDWCFRSVSYSIIRSSSNKWLIHELNWNLVQKYRYYYYYYLYGVTLIIHSASDSGLCPYSKNVELRKLQ
jgi:hypothetical protein